MVKAQDACPRRSKSCPARSISDADRSGTGMSIERDKIRWNGWGWTAHKDTVAEREELWTWLAEQLGMPALLATPARPIEDVRMPAPRLTAHMRTALIATLGQDRVRDDTYERAFHALGRSYYDLLRLRSGELNA